MKKIMIFVVFNLQRAGLLASESNTIQEPWHANPHTQKYDTEPLHHLYIQYVYVFTISHFYGAEDVLSYSLRKCFVKSCIIVLQ